MSLINIQQLKFAYQTGKNILDIDQLQIQHGRFTILYGPSGSGKSTLLKIMAGFLPRDGGQLTGQIDLGINEKPTMMFQDPSLQFALDTPRHEIEFALENLQVPAQQIESRVQQAISQVGIEKLADRQFASLSGGEQQMAALAVIIGMNSSLILLDEPFANLDHRHRQLLIDQLSDLEKQGKTIIIADHDLNGYQELNADIISFGQPIHKLSPADAKKTLNQKVTPLLTALPTKTDQVALSLHNFQLSRPDNLLIQQDELAIYRGKTTLLTGESGTGKSSFFKSLAKLLPYQGQLTLFNQEIRQLSAKQLGRMLGLVFQRATDQFLEITVAEELKLSQRQGRSSFFTDQEVKKALHDLGLAHMENRVVYSLSGGQQKKLQLLLMLMMGQPLLLLDEPFSGLDPHSVQIVSQLIRRCQEHTDLTVLIISHQLNNLENLIDYHLQLTEQKLVYQGGGQDES